MPGEVGGLPGPLPFGPAQLSLGDGLAVATAYNQLFAYAAACPDARLRAAVCALTPGRAAMAGVTALAGMVGFLAGHPDDPLYDAFAGLVGRAVDAAGYPELGEEHRR